MAYDQGLEERIRDYFAAHRTDVELRKMLGGLCFLLSGNMCCGIIGDKLMARVGPIKYDECLAQEYASKMDFTGRSSMKGIVYVHHKGLEDDSELDQWLTLCEEFAGALQPK